MSSGHPVPVPVERLMSAVEIGNVRIEGKHSTLQKVHVQYGANSVTHELVMDLSVARSLLSKLRETLPD